MSINRIGIFAWLISLTLFAAAKAPAQDNAPVYEGGDIAYLFDLDEMVAWDLGADYGIALTPLRINGIPCLEMGGLPLCYLVDPRLVSDSKITFVGNSEVRTVDGEWIQAEEYRIVHGDTTTNQFSTKNGAIVAFSFKPQGESEVEQYRARSAAHLLTIPSRKGAE